MLFKHVQWYRFSEPFVAQSQSVDESLQAHRFKSCGAAQQHSIGWVNPVTRQLDEDSTFVHATLGAMLVCAKQEQRILPAGAVREQLDERIEQIEQQTGRRVRGKQKTELKDEVVFDMLPRAFTQSRYTYALIDVNNGWLLVDAASTAKAEEIIDLLRQSLGGLPVSPMHVEQSPSATMTDWLSQQVAPVGFEFMEQCELRAMDESGAAVRLTRHDLSADEIQSHLQSSKRVVKLKLDYQSRVQFVLDETLMIKQIKWLDTVLDEREGMTEHAIGDQTVEFDADFALVVGELRTLLPALLDVLGGEAAAV